MRAKACLPLFAALLVINGSSVAQERAEQRREWLSPGSPVSDDPRRVPVPRSARPDGSMVLRGGRVSDATGAATREATVVIERNRIAATLPPTLTQWPSTA